MQSTELSPLLLVGATGMLGRAFAALLTRENLAFKVMDLPEIDLAVPESICAAVQLGVRTVINCAAFTNVDAAESDEATATAINGESVGVLARRCAELGATLVHFSTDYVFDGYADRPYPVDHQRAPINAYGRSKALGERLLEQSTARHLLVRTSWLYAPWGKNFVLTMRELMRTRASVKVVGDQVGRPTSAEYLAERSFALLRRGCTGSFHVTDGGQCSWYGFAARIAASEGSSCQIVPCTTEEFPRPASRPRYSVLDLSLTEAEIGPSRPWEESLERVLSALS